MTPTKTARTYAIAQKAKNMDDISIMQYWLSLSADDRSLFDNVSDFLTASKSVK